MSAKQYAEALYQLPATKAHLPKLRALLKQRGHEKLLPQIFAEYQKVLLREKRLAMHRATSPQKEQTRVLLELYKKLVASG